MGNEDISSIISKIVSNPEFAGMVNELRAQNGAEETTQEEMLSKLPEVMKMVSPLMQQAEDGSDSGGKAPKREKGEKKSSDGTGFDKVRATKLMQALKPYLSSGRGEIIDKCVSVMQIGDLVSQLGGMENIEKLMNGNGGK